MVYGFEIFALMQVYHCAVYRQFIGFPKKKNLSGLNITISFWAVCKEFIKSIIWMERKKSNISKDLVV